MMSADEVVVQRQRHVMPKVMFDAERHLVCIRVHETLARREAEGQEWQRDRSASGTRRQERLVGPCCRSIRCRVESLLVAKEVQRRSQRTIAEPSRKRICRIQAASTRRAAEQNQLW